MKSAVGGDANSSSGFSGHGSKQRNIYLRDARQTIENLNDMF